MYSIKEAAERSGITAHTIRYYEKEGLLPFVERKPSGVRVFSDRDLAWLSLITCLKNTGMPIKGIREFVNWYMEGDVSLAQRLEMFEAHKKNVEEQIAQLQKYLEKIDYKVWYYQTAVEAGTIDVHKRDSEAV